MRFPFNLLLMFVAFAALVTTSGCPPLRTRSASSAADTYVVEKNRLFDESSKFDVRAKLEYSEYEEAGLKDPRLDVTDRELTMLRCTWCHECGFEEAFDWPHYGSAQWQPQLVGEQWAPVVARMAELENSYLNETIAFRIYKYLRDDTTGKYDEAKDSRGAVVIEVDPESNAAEPDEPANE